MDITHHNPQEQTDCIIVDNVSFSYGQEPILENITFKITSGDYVGIIGPNGGGKTTLLKLMLGLLKPATGSVKIFGQDIHQLRKERAHIGYVPQRSAQIDTEFPATVKEIVASGRIAKTGLFKNFNQDDEHAIDRALEITEMSPYKNTLINNLSGGQRQRVFIARALAGEPQILFLDEPTAGVDIHSEEQFYAFLSKLNNTLGLTVIIVSHDIDVITQEIKTVLAINRKLVAQGSTSQAITQDYFKKLYTSKQPLNNQN